MNALTDIEKDLIDASSKKVLNFRPGDTVKVYQKIIEGNKERIQVFEGVVISISNKGASKTFTVRRISYDVGVERLFLLHSPRIAKIEVVRRGHVRRAKLYYLRDKIGKSGRIREKKYAQILKIEEQYSTNQNAGANEEEGIPADLQAETNTENAAPEIETKEQ